MGNEAGTDVDIINECGYRSFPLRSLSLYAPLPSASVTSYGPSHLGPSFPPSSAWLASLLWLSSTSISAVLKVGMPINAGITAFVSYISENEVSPLLDLILVRCAHRTRGISSTQSLLPLSYRTFIPSPKRLFALSPKSLACGCLMEAKRWRMLSFSHQSLNRLSLNCFPLSDIISHGRPNL
uniref:Uncharacterized protein n=1 Tax=Tanacetum cinerariifolium TaxID=118510 RepID=A0A699H9K8_TANCI|nr:hypothetical protein [Tanacetum cinerariifolium]